MRIAEYNPKTGLTYRDATPEEIAEMQLQEEIEIPKTAEEIIAEQQEEIDMLSELLDSLLTDVLPNMIGD